MATRKYNYPPSLNDIEPVEQASIGGDLIFTKYLVVNAAGEARILARAPKSVGLAEAMYELQIRVPQRKEIVAGKIELVFPEVPAVKVEAQFKETRELWQEYKDEKSSGPGS